MKHTALLAILLAGALAGSAVSQTGAAATSADPASGANLTKIGIIDIQSAILATNEGRRDFEALQKKFEPKQTELQRLNQEVEDLKKQLETQGSKLNDEARGSLVKNIETKQKALQRQAEDAQTDFQQQRDEIASRILQKLGPVLDKFAKERNYAVILDASQPWPQGQVVWAARPVDVTKEIVDAYNASAGVPAPTSAPAAPSATSPSSARTTGTATGGSRTTAPAKAPAAKTPAP